jgi:uncharacterized protein YegJ (DUF2314 family)
MKNFPLFLFAFCASRLVGAATGYQDQPMGLTAKGAALVASYEEQARKTLHHFDDELGKPNGRSFFVVTKIYGKDLFEQVYVRVESKQQAAYKGRIVSEPTGSVSFKKGAELAVQTKDVADWCIVMPNGEEEGNLTGKAMDALQARILVFVLSMKPEKSTFTRFSVVTVRNSKTQQSVDELVPGNVILNVENEAKNRWGTLKADDEKEKFQFILVGFPEWKILEK